MKKLLFILLLTIPFFGCGERGSFSSSDHYDNGQVKSEGTFKKNKLHGLWRFYYENGQSKYHINYTYGKKNGIYKQWYENGQLQYESTYKDGVKISGKCWDLKGNKIKCK